MTGRERRTSVTLLDGGMGRELLKMGAPFQQPEWSALALMKEPHFVKLAHERFAAAGSEVLTTNTYAIVPFHIGEERFFTSGPELADLAGKLALEVAQKYGCRVAGALPPVFGSYRPDLYVESEAYPLLQLLIEALSPYTDIWLAETLSSIVEAETVLNALSKDKRPVWIAYTLLDGGVAGLDAPRLRSGENVRDALLSVVEHGASAVLFNCSQPEAMLPAVEIAVEVLDELKVEIPIGVYANAFAPQTEPAEANLELQDVRPEIDPSGYADLAYDWYRNGATIIGGCCGIGPEHIHALRKRLKKGPTVTPLG